MDTIGGSSQMRNVHKFSISFGIIADCADYRAQSRA